MSKKGITTIGREEMELIEAIFAGKGQKTGNQIMIFENSFNNQITLYSHITLRDSDGKNDKPYITAILYNGGVEVAKIENLKSVIGNHKFVYNGTTYTTVIKRGKPVSQLRSAVRDNYKMYIN